MSAGSVHMPARVSCEEDADYECSKPRVRVSLVVLDLPPWLRAPSTLQRANYEQAASVVYLVASAHARRLHTHDNDAAPLRLLLVDVECGDGEGDTVGEGKWCHMRAKNGTANCFPGWAGPESPGLGPGMGGAWVGENLRPDPTTGREAGPGRAWAQALGLAGYRIIQAQETKVLPFESTAGQPWAHELFMQIHNKYLLKALLIRFPTHSVSSGLGDKSTVITFAKSLSKGWFSICPDIKRDRAVLACLEDHIGISNQRLQLWINSSLWVENRSEGAQWVILHHASTKLPSVTSFQVTDIQQNVHSGGTRRAHREFVASIDPELALNSETWACLACGGRPAPQTCWVSLFKEKVDERFTIMMSPQCEECMPKSQDTTRKSIEGLETKEGLKRNTIPMPESMNNGLLSGACPTCRQEHTAALEFSMLRCAKCKLVRFADIAGKLHDLRRVACQKEDWVRHKAICGKITNVSRKANRLPKSPESQSNIAI
ncbi:hypothetical protein B0H14DRAFT_2574614 [Mycena olivaceomarginata]|nr:hypothetical protein B0H14DRAFT_2574614 [Mycena olivaceomarginata]